MSKEVTIIDLKNQVYENSLNLIVYEIISKNINTSLNKFPLENNIVAVYAIHLLKFLTSLILKSNELKKKNVLSEFKNSKLKNFPYISYKEIHENKILNNKKFGITADKQFRQIIKSYIFLINNYKKNKITSSLNALSIKKFKYLNHYFNANFLSFNNKFYYRDIENQINIFKDIIDETYDKVNLPFDPLTTFDIFKKHVIANTYEGIFKNRISGDYVLLTSGNDTINRHIAANAKQFNKKVIIFDHAYYTGYTDDINLGMGEQYFADYFISFGDYYKSNKTKYDFSKEFNCKIITSSSKKIKKIKKIKFNEFKYNSDTLFYYFPTSLRGVNYRFGPFMDIADKTYLKWQKNLEEIFKKKLVFKHHPKDKFKNIYKNYHSNSNVSYENINNILNFKKNFCFIFDTIGTAFAEAAASRYPIIFFDLHQRKIPYFVLKKIKERCVYIDVLQFKKISFSYIEELLITKKFDYNSLDTFSLEKLSSTKDQIEVLKEYFKNYEII